MHKISNFTGSARHGWEKMTPSMGFGMSRSHNDLPVTTPIKRPSGASAVPPAIPPGTQVNLSFNVPFSSNLAGPDVDDIMYASPGAKARWTHPEGTAEGIPNHKLPVHAQNVENLRNLCREMGESSDGRIQAVVVSSEPKPLPGLQRGPLRALVTNVCLSGELEIVNQMRAKILNETPISLVGYPIHTLQQMRDHADDDENFKRSSSVDIDSNLIFDTASSCLKSPVLNQLDLISKTTKADIFVLMPKQPDIESASFNGKLETSLDSRLRCTIYGDMESMEHAKTRILIMIDQIVSVACTLTV
jgi:hypothetical protein